MLYTTHNIIYYYPVGRIILIYIFQSNGVLFFISSVFELIQPNIVTYHLILIFNPTYPTHFTTIQLEYNLREGKLGLGWKNHTQGRVGLGLRLGDIDVRLGSQPRGVVTVPLGPSQHPKQEEKTLKICPMTLYLVALLPANTRSKGVTILGDHWQLL